MLPCVCSVITVMVMVTNSYSAFDVLHIQMENEMRPDQNTGNYMPNYISQMTSKCGKNKKPHTRRSFSRLEKGGLQKSN